MRDNGLTMHDILKKNGVTPRGYKRVQQGDPYGCAIACLAMAARTDYPTMRRVVEAYCDVYEKFELFTGLSHEDEKNILWAMGIDAKYVRRFGNGLRDYVATSAAILCVPSLNVEGLYHGVFWTGRLLYDPSPFRQYEADKAWESAVSASVIAPIDFAAPRTLRGIEGGVA